MHPLLERYIRLNAAPAAYDTGKDFFTLRKVQKGEQLLLAGEVCQQLYFINSGCVRTYYITPEGLEKTRFIAFEGIMVSSLGSFISQSPSFEYIDALENSEVLSIQRSDFFDLIRRYEDWKTFYLTLLEQAYIHQNQRIELLVTLPAKQRYETLLQQNPALVRRLPNKVLATYLDVSQETLSRIKSK